jgi:hypothetical protein
MLVSGETMMLHAAGAAHELRPGEALRIAARPRETIQT